MTGELVLGVDIGTTSVKAVVLDRSGAVSAIGESDPVTTLSPEPGAAEQDPYELWAALGAACHRAVTGLDPVDRVAAIALAAQSGSVAPVTEGAEALGPLVTWMDTRSGPLVDSWDAGIHRLIRELSGWTAAPGLGLPTIAWLRQNRSAIFDRAVRFAAADDIMAHRLTGIWATNPSNGSGLQLMDVRTQEWSDELCAVAGIEPARLSPLRPTGSILGSLTTTAASSTGLEPGTPVVVGGHDQACAALGLGVVEPGSVFLAAGTAWVLTAITDHADPARLPATLNLSPHVTPVRWSASTYLGGIGAMLSWWRRERDPSAPDAADVPIDMDTPFFRISLHDHHRSGWGRFEAADHPRADPACEVAVFEAAALEVSTALASLAGVVPPLTTLTVVGGSTRGRRLMQILADVTGLTVRVAGETSWAAIGAGRVAASAMGWPTDPDFGTRDHGQEIFRPDAAATAIHERRFSERRGGREGDNP
ncbi:MAG: FGGY-family carbohydrate kinase [Actinomycetia bacterium]|nr:FGGY-family carbohydrate kinase [Actinomycetes bacterium]